MNKISLQTSLERNFLILDVNFENLIVGLYVLIIFLIFVNFQED